MSTRKEGWTEVGPVSVVVLAPGFCTNVQENVNGLASTSEEALPSSMIVYVTTVD